MNGEDPLQNLKDIHLPEAISFWPPAPGWWVLTIIVLMAMIWLIKKVWKIYQKKHLLRISVQTMGQLQIAYKKHQDPQRLIREYSSLLRRISLTVAARDQVASLTGKPWLEFLDNTAKTQLFDSAAGQLLLNAPYQKPETTIPHIEQLTQAIEQWIKAIYKQTSKTRGSQ